MTVGQAERMPAYQLLADELRAEITSGRLRPGERLPTEPQLCERSGVSRSTVREALRLLASQHLIVTTRGVTGGSFVTRPSVAQLAETISGGMGLLMTTGTVGAEHLFEVRETFEVPAAGLAAERRTDDDLSTMATALFDPETAGLDEMLDAHRKFHGAVAAATGNPIYELITRPLYSLANERTLAAQAPTSFWRRVDAEHQEILGAIGRCDARAARAAARAHVDHLRSVYVESAVTLAG